MTINILQALISVSLLRRLGLELLAHLFCAYCFAVAFVPKAKAEPSGIGSGNPGLKVAMRKENPNCIVIYQDEPYTAGSGGVAGIKDRAIKVIIDNGYGFRQDSVEVSDPIPMQLYPFDLNSAFASEIGSWSPDFKTWQYTPRSYWGFSIFKDQLTTFTNVQTLAATRYHLKTDEMFLGFLDNNVYFWKKFNPSKVYWREQSTAKEYYCTLPKGVVDLYGITRGIRSAVGCVVFRKSTGLLHYSPYERDFIEIRTSSGKLMHPIEN